MNMFARFDENPAMTLQDIKETKRYGRTDNVKTVYPPQTKFAGGYIYAYKKALFGKNCLSSHSCHFVKKKISGPTSFMHMFNVFTLYRQSIKLFHQKLW